MSKRKGQERSGQAELKALPFRRVKAAISDPAGPRLLGGGRIPKCSCHVDHLHALQQIVTDDHPPRPDPLASADTSGLAQPD